MSILKPRKINNKDFEKVKKLSSLVEKRLANFNKGDKNCVEKLTREELQDLNEILRITDLILTKYETKKEVHSLLKEFVGIITKSATSVENLDDEICEFLISAEGTIKQIKTLQGNVSENYDIESKNIENQTNTNHFKNSANNLTKSSTAVYTQEYQQNSRIEAEQVI